MDKYTEYGLVLEQLNKIAFMGGADIEENAELIKGDLAPNNKAIVESLTAIKDYFVNEFPRATKAFKEYEDELFYSADVKSLYNRQIFIREALKKALHLAEELSSSDDFDKEKADILNATPPKVEKPMKGSKSAPEKVNLPLTDEQKEELENRGQEALRVIYEDIKKLRKKTSDNLVSLLGSNFKFTNKVDPKKLATLPPKVKAIVIT